MSVKYCNTHDVCIMIVYTEVNNICGDDRMSKFANRLRELRKEKNVNQQKLSNYLGYGYTAIANYESGRNEPSIDTICKIADYFDVTVDYLIGHEDNPKRVDAISKAESELIMRFRNMDNEDQRILLEMAKSLSSKR